MKYSRAYKHELIIKRQEQIVFLEQSFGCNRLIYNYLLNRKKEAWEKDKTKLSKGELSEVITNLKKDKDYKFLSTPPSVILQQSLIDLDKAFKNFYNGYGYPKFKKKERII